MKRILFLVIVILFISGCEGSGLCSYVPRNLSDSCKSCYYKEGNDAQNSCFANLFKNPSYCILIDDDNVKRQCCKSLVSMNLQPSDMIYPYARDDEDAQKKDAQAYLRDCINIAAEDAPKDVTPQQISDEERAQEELNDAVFRAGSSISDATCPITLPNGAVFSDLGLSTYYQLNGNYIGPSLTYFDEAKTKIQWLTCFDENGLEHGPKYELSVTGVKLQELNLVHGKFEGEQITRWPNGNIMSTQDYRDGKYDGERKMYDETGKLYRTETYIMGKMTDVKNS